MLPYRMYDSLNTSVNIEYIYYGCYLQVIVVSNFTCIFLGREVIGNEDMAS